MTQPPGATQPRHDHASVLLEGAVDALVQKPEGVYVDGTFGRGGHARAILERLGKGGRLIAIDRDPEALAAAEAIDDPRFSIHRATFAELGNIARKLGLHGGLDGVLLDVGVSSPQLDDAERGFSFMRDGPLDMRMDPDSGISAARWLAQASESEMADIFKRLGEERHARRLARAVVARRREAPIERTHDLAELIKSAHPAWEKGKHPATRVFQAIRIHLNDELGELQRALDAAHDALAAEGRLVVISFHSLEDRMVKRFIRDRERGDRHLPRGVPLREDQIERSMAPVGRAVRPDERETAGNVRARSAVMRVARRLKHSGGEG